MQSKLDAALIRAYHETEYRITQGSHFSLQIDVVSRDLVSLYKSSKVSCAAFITACNPLSRQLSDVENAKRQGELGADLTQRGLTFPQGVGKHRSGNWPGELSFLILGLALEAAKSLGESYEQNAIIWCGPDAIPELILLR